MKKECLYCDFCGKSQHEVKKICLGPNSAAICDECAALAVEVMSRPDAAAPPEGKDTK